MIKVLVYHTVYGDPSVYINDEKKVTIDDMDGLIQKLAKPHTEEYLVLDYYQPDDDDEATPDRILWDLNCGKYKTNYQARVAFDAVWYPIYKEEC